MLFSVIFACGEFYAQVRDIAFGRDMRFARWKLQGEYNITAERSGAISLRALRVISRRQSRHITKSLYNSLVSCSFLVIFACGEFYAQVRDIAFGSDMRFARWKLQGEYNITVSVANNITFAKQKYHAERKRSISLNSLQLTTFML